jgi:hypothetical protein
LLGFVSSGALIFWGCISQKQYPPPTLPPAVLCCAVHRFDWSCALQVDAENTDLCFSKVDNTLLDFKSAGSTVSFQAGVLAPGTYVLSVIASAGSAARGSLIPNHLRCGGS